MSRRSRSRGQQRRLKNLQSNRAATKDEQPSTWYCIKNFVDQPDTAAIYLYGEIGYWGVEAQDFVRDLMSLRVANIIVHINSPGGEVFDGLAIYHALRDHPANIECRVDGLAASAASFIAMAGDKVVMQRNAQMMIHDASGIEIGNADDMRTMGDLLDRCSDNIADIYMQQAGGTVEQWRAVMKTETWYSADEALTAGLVDEVNNADEETDEPAAVVPGDEDPDALMDKAWDLSVFAYTYAGRDKAPAPKPVTAAVEPEAAPPAPPVELAPVDPEPVVDPSEEDEVVDEPDVVEPEPDLEQVDEPVIPAEEPLVIGDTWAAMTRALFDPEPQPSTVDELLAALQKKGLPA